MKVVFRADASFRIGTGHLVRCRTLATVLHTRGSDVTFVCRDHSGNILDSLGAERIPVKRLPAPVNSSAEDGDYARWLGVSQADDAEQTLRAFCGDYPDWLIVDHYGLDSTWENALQPHVGKILAIDDLANRSHDCDLLLDQNYTTRNESKYADLLPRECRLLTGTRYALLRPEYAAYRRALAPREGPVHRILLFLGNETANLTGMVLEALAAPEFSNLDVDVVLGLNNPHRHEISLLIAKRPNTCLHAPQPHLAELMSQADLAIGAGGTTTWERMCLGLPAFVISLAENQRPSCEALQDAGIIHYAGHAPDLETNKLRHELADLISDEQRMTQMSHQGQMLVDGFGALRVAELIKPTPTNDLRLRSAQPSDSALYFEWVNEVDARRYSFNSEPITWESHTKWFANKLSNLNCRMYVLEARGLPIGQVRFDWTHNEAHLGYSLDTLVRGRGWGASLISLGISHFRNINQLPMFAEVKAENTASCKVFSRLNFRLLRATGEVRTYYLAPNAPSLQG